MGYQPNASKEINATSVQTTMKVHMGVNNY
jgi:hypothetical protein